MLNTSGEAAAARPLVRYSRVVRRIESRYAAGVKAVPGTLQEGGAAFQSTHWTLVLLAARSQSEEAARAALADLCQTYWPPLYTFLRRRGRSPGEAQDLTQAFFAHLIATKDVNPGHAGKRPVAHFPSRFLAAFPRQRIRPRPSPQTRRRPADRFHGRRPHRSGSGLAHRLTGQDDCKGYDQQWAANLVSLAWEQLHRAMVVEGKAELIARPETVRDWGHYLAAEPGGTWRPDWGCRFPRSATRCGGCASVTGNVSGQRSRVPSASATEIDEEMRYLLRVLLS